MVTTEAVRALIEVPRLMSEALKLEPQIEKLSHDLAKAQDVLYLGRGTSFPIAMEGALKLKEISYIHAEGYPAAEMKHGPIALIEEGVPVVVIVPSPRGRATLHDKIVSNIQEVRARGAVPATIAIVDGRLKPFAGPLLDNTGRQRLAGGALDDNAIANMDWLVQGVSGSVPQKR